MYLSEYSSVPNKRVGPLKRVGTKQQILPTHLSTKCYVVLNKRGVKYFPQMFNKRAARLFGAQKY